MPDTNLTRRALYFAVPLLAAGAIGLPAPSAPAPAVAHPHFQKKVEVQLPGLKLAVTHITVPYNAEKADEVETGAAWHMGNAHVELSAGVKIGGIDVEAGRYSLKSRKTEKGWELLLDEPSRFSRKIGEDAKSLATHFEAEQPDYEHLSLDIQPAGDKDSTKLFLDARFGAQLARCEIELSEEHTRRRRRR